MTIPVRGSAWDAEGAVKRHARTGERDPVDDGVEHPFRRGEPPAGRAASKAAPRTGYGAVAGVRGRDPADRERAALVGAAVQRRPGGAAARWPERDRARDPRRRPRGRRRAAWWRRARVAQDVRQRRPVAGQRLTSTSAKPPRSSRPSQAVARVAPVVVGLLVQLADERDGDQQRRAGPQHPAQLGERRARARRRARAPRCTATASKRRVRDGQVRGGRRRSSAPARPRARCPASPASRARSARTAGGKARRPRPRPARACPRREARGERRDGVGDRPALDRAIAR